MKKIYLFSIVALIVFAAILPYQLRANNYENSNAVFKVDTIPTAKIIVFPVPLRDHFYIQNNDSTLNGATVELFDVTERVIAAGNIGMGRNYFPVVDKWSNTRTANAIYVLKITSTKTGKIRTQMIVQQY